MCIRREKITFAIELNSSDENYELLQQILKIAENVTINGRDLLEDAVVYQDEKMAEKIFESGKVSKEQCNKYLEHAVYNEKIFKMFIKAGAEINNEFYGSRCLERAVVNGNAKSVQRVIKNCAKVNANTLQYCLGIAVECGDSEKVKSLIDFGADVKKLERKYVEKAVLLKKLGTLKLLVKEGLILKEYDVWESGIKTNDSDIIQFLIKEKAYQGNPKMLSAVIEAANIDNDYNKGLVEQLIRLKADVNEYQGLPLYFATEKSSKIEILKILLKSRAKVTGKDYKNAQLAIINVIKNEDEEMLKLLIEAGADVTVKNNIAIAIAAEIGNEKIMDMLIEAGADIRANNDKALIYAATAGQLKIVKKLISLGADITAQEHGPMRWAGTARQEEIVEYLAKLGENKEYSKFLPDGVDVHYGDVLGVGRVYQIVRKSDGKIIYYETGR